MLCKHKRIVTVATTAELKNEHYYRRLWLAARNIQYGRRKWPDELSDCFIDCGYSYEVQYPSGETFPIPDIDETFGNDPDARWVSDYLMADQSGMRPRYKSRKLGRVQLIDLYFRIKYPHIARHFGR